MLSTALNETLSESRLVGRPRSVPQPKIIAAIPAYNEEKYIGEVVRRARKYVHQVVVIDDGSTDRTAAVAEAAGAKVVRHELNKNYGGAIKSCFAVARKMKADILVTFDGDGQHKPEDIPVVIKPILEGKYDLVIGSRFLNDNNKIPRYRRFGIDVITWLYNVGAKYKVTDAQSGFRAYSKKAIMALQSLKDDQMAISVETLIKARKHQLSISEVPITCIYHGEGSTLNPIKHGLSVALATVIYRITA
jgi:glycosyltransferase involved in cell wall biosynthesis